MSLIDIINEEILLQENPNQAIKFLKTKNLDPTTNPEGKRILNSITGITRGDGYTYLLTRFHLIDKLPINDLQKLHDYFKQNREQITRLPKPVVSYETYRQLRQDIDDLESMRVLKKLYNELPAILKQQHQTLPIQRKQELKDLAGKFNTILTPEQQNFFIKKVSGYRDINNFIDNLKNYIFSIENKEDYTSIKQKIEATPNAFVAYDNPDKNIIIAHINAFDASKTLGCTSSWCITRDPQFWRNYKKGGNKYFFIWDFKYPASNMNYLIGTAYDPKNPSHSRTHLKDNKSVNFETVLKKKRLSNKIFDAYIKDFAERLLQGYGAASGLVVAMKNAKEDPIPLVDLIQKSNVITQFGKSENVYYDNGVIELGLSKEQMKEMLELGDEFDWINNTAYSYYGSRDYDTDEVNYMYSGLNKDNLELLYDLARKIGVPQKEVEGFAEKEGAIYKFLDKYGFTVISDTYASEYSEAQDEAEKNAAKELINEVPFDVDDAKFTVDNMLTYMVNNEITADNFDQLIEQVKEKLPEFSYDSISEARYTDMDLDNLNIEVKKDIEKIINEIETDETSPYYTRAKTISRTNDELSQMGFKLLGSDDDDIAEKKFTNMKIIVNDAEIDEDTDGVVVTASLIYNDSYYKKKRKPAPKSRKIKVPIKSLRNYIQQPEIPFKIDETKLKKLVLEEILTLI